jgi:hypothetical protein
MGRAAPGRVFSNLRDLVGSDFCLLGSEGRPKVSCLYVVVRPFLTTILPPTPRPTGRLGGSNGGPKKSKIKSYKSKANAPSIEWNNDANNCWSNDLCNDLNNAPSNDG